MSFNYHLVEGKLVAFQRKWQVEDVNLDRSISFGGMTSILAVDREILLKD